MTSSNSADFYANLPVIEHFFNASNSRNYQALPENWYLAITDVVNSTAAIKNDRYKTVNILGVSPIVGILNVADRDRIPYSFGGDGAVFCIPSTLLNDARRVLGASRKIGKEEYGLNLRAAIIPVTYIRERGNDIRVARYQASEFYDQAIFSGGGISYAEEMLKKNNSGQFQVPVSNSAESIDFTGLECRWKEVRRNKKEVITLLIKCNPDIDQSDQVYEQVLHKLREIFGFEGKTNPINVPRLSMNLSFGELMDEAKIRTFGKGWLTRLRYIAKVQLQTIIGKILMALNYRTAATDWAKYKADIARNSDHRKFDDMLRLVISGTRTQRNEFENFLRQEFKEERLAYGIHISDAALITCMVFHYHREHMHFVDGSGGGYAEASKELKKRIKQLQKE